MSNHDALISLSSITQDESANLQGLRITATVTHNQQPKTRGQLLEAHQHQLRLGDLPTIETIDTKELKLNKNQFKLSDQQWKNLVDKHQLQIKSFPSLDAQQLNLKNQSSSINSNQQMSSSSMLLLHKKPHQTKRERHPKSKVTYDRDILIDNQHAPLLSRRHDNLVTSYNKYSKAVHNFFREFIKTSKAPEGIHPITKVYYFKKKSYNQLPKTNCKQKHKCIYQPLSKPKYEEELLSTNDRSNTTLKQISTSHYKTQLLKPHGSEQAVTSTAPMTDFQYRNLSTSLHIHSSVLSHIYTSVSPQNESLNKTQNHQSVSPLAVMAHRELSTVVTPRSSQLLATRGLPTATPNHKEVKELKDIHSVTTRNRRPMVVKDQQSVATKEQHSTATHKQHSIVIQKQKSTATHRQHSTEAHKQQPTTTQKQHIIRSHDQKLAKANNDQNIKNSTQHSVEKHKQHPTVFYYEKFTASDSKNSGGMHDQQLKESRKQLATDPNNLTSAGSHSEELSETHVAWSPGKDGPQCAKLLNDNHHVPGVYIYLLKLFPKFILQRKEEICVLMDAV